MVFLSFRYLGLNYISPFIPVGFHASILPLIKPAEPRQYPILPLAGLGTTRARISFLPSTEHSSAILRTCSAGSTIIPTRISRRTGLPGNRFPGSFFGYFLHSPSLCRVQKLFRSLPGVYLLRVLRGISGYLIGRINKNRKAMESFKIKVLHGFLVVPPARVELATTGLGNLFTGCHILLILSELGDFCL